WVSTWYTRVRRRTPKSRPQGCGLGRSRETRRVVASEVASSRGASAFADRVAGAGGQPRPQALLEIENLHVQFVTSHGTVRAVEGLSYSVRPGEMVAIVGESGSGKSVSALAVMRLLPPGTSRIPSGKISFDGGKELLKL